MVAGEKLEKEKQENKLDSEDVANSTVVVNEDETKDWLE